MDRIVIARHGEYNDITGSLNERGIAQVEALAKYLAEQPLGSIALYVSPKKRAQESAAIISQSIGMVAQLAEGLDEYGYGKGVDALIEAATAATIILVTHRPLIPSLAQVYTDKWETKPHRADDVKKIGTGKAVYLDMQSQLYRIVP